MKIAIVGSRNGIIENLETYIPDSVTEIVSGGAKGIDTCAEEFARQNSIKFTKFLPQYNIYGKAAPIKRNIEIVNYSDMVIAFGDGKSKGTKFVIDYCNKNNKNVIIIRI